MTPFSSNFKKSCEMLFNSYILYINNIIVVIISPIGFIMSPLDRGRHIVFGFILIVFVVVVVCVIPCEHDNFSTVLNFIFELELCIDHINL